MAIYVDWIVQLHQYNLLIYALVVLSSIAAEGVVLSVAMNRMLKIVGLKPRRENK